MVAHRSGGGVGKRPGGGGRRDGVDHRSVEVAAHRLPVAPPPRDRDITYVLAGTVEHGDSIGNRGDEVTVQAGEEGIRFLLVSGKPLEEPVAWYGPIVMNTQEQLRQAYEELQEGTFLNARG
jgi:redox-sensitive bicupin YhaK (pirin superfamily)